MQFNIGSALSRCRRRSISRKIVTFWKQFLGLSVLLIATYYLFALTIFDFRDDTEIRMILKDTPYLWRKSVYNKTDSVSQRIEDQRLWIQRISKADYIRNFKEKIIFVQNGMDSYYFTKGRIQCPYAPEFERKCRLQEDKWRRHETFVLLLDYWRYFGKDVVTGVRDWETGRYEPIMPRVVKQILYILENPHSYTKAAHIGRNDALLASYMKGSDIPIPYFRWIPYKQSQRFDTKKLDELLIGKTKKAVALISNCKNRNHRLDYIKELQQHIQVDVFGKCGNLTCNNHGHNGNGPGYECLSMLEKDYKFYLAFENTNCVDYITEKFFINGLNYSMLPVVMGAHPDSYLVDSPPHSYIHVEDFESPAALGAYLNYLDKSDSAYKEYFKWKGTGYTTSHGESLHDFFCRLCGMLFYADFVPSPSWNNSEITWEDVNYCLPEGQWYWPK